MPTIFSHAIAASALNGLIKPGKLFDRWFVAAALLSMLPDIDVLGFRFGIRYGDLLGHRGLTHSILFAAVLAACSVLLLRTDEKPSFLVKIWLVLFLSTCSHGVLDAFTSGGLGVAFFSPFSNERFFLPWRPIRVSPIGIGRFFSRAMQVLKSELIWIWLPSVLLLTVTLFFRKPKVAR